MNQSLTTLNSYNIYHLLWTIPEDFGGMTNAVLRRATEFSRITGRHHEILTLSASDEPLIRTAALHEDGRLGTTVSIRNIWHDLAFMTDIDLRRLKGQSELNQTPSPSPRRSSDAEERRYSHRGELLQIDRYRPDGTLLASDERDVSKSGEQGGRRITLFLSDGDIQAQWNSAALFFHAWFDYLLDGSDKSAIICDSKYAGKFLVNYINKAVLKIQGIHSYHLLPGEPITGRLRPSRAAVLRNADSFDAVTVLTKAQHHDFIEANICVGNCFVVSNFVDTPDLGTIGIRQPARAALVGRLAKEKQVDQAIAAIDRAAKQYPQIHLDIFGNGSEERRLRRLVAERQLFDHVTFHGSVPDAATQFQAASFSLLTSRVEGQSLVLLESLAAGCIPVSYDIKYGPSSLIEDGHNGFLVEPGNIDQLTATIIRLVEAPASELDRMRHAGLESIEQYKPERIAEEWADLLNFCWQHRSRNTPLALDISAKLRRYAFRGDALHLKIDVDGVLPRGSVDWAAVAWVGRDPSIYGRVFGKIRRRRKAYLTFKIPTDRVRFESTLDIYVDLRIAGHVYRRRVTADAVRRPFSFGSQELYSTVKQNLSIR